MKLNYYAVLQASPVSEGFYFKAMFTWWQIPAIIAVIILIFYPIRKKRS